MCERENRPPKSAPRPFFFFFFFPRRNVSNGTSRSRKTQKGFLFVWGQTTYIRITYTSTNGSLVCGDGERPLLLRLQVSRARDTPPGVHGITLCAWMENYAYAKKRSAAYDSTYLLYKRGFVSSVVDHSTVDHSLIKFSFSFFFLPVRCIILSNISASYESIFRKRTVLKGAATPWKCFSGRIFIAFLQPTAAMIARPLTILYLYVIAKMQKPYLRFIWYQTLPPLFLRFWVCVGVFQSSSVQLISVQPVAVISLL